MARHGPRIMETIARLPLDPDPERNTEWMYLPSDRAIPKLHLDFSAWVIVGLIQRFPSKGSFLAEKTSIQIGLRITQLGNSG